MPDTAVDTVIRDNHRSALDRARDAIRRARTPNGLLLPSRLAREIAIEIAEAERVAIDMAQPRRSGPAPKFNPGDRVLVREQPLLPPLIVHAIRTHFAGEPESNGPVWCAEECVTYGYSRLQKYDRCELVPCPPGHEPAPTSDAPTLALCWLYRNLGELVALHGADTIARAEQHVRDSIRLERIGAALAAEPEASAVRLTEIAMGAPAGVFE